MKKASLTAIIAFTLLISLLVAPDAVQTAKANWLPQPPKLNPGPTITVDKPKSYEEYSNKVSLDFSVTCDFRWPVVSFGYILDSSPIEFFAPTIVHTEIIKDYYPLSFLRTEDANFTRYSATIDGLKSGVHFIQIQVKTNSPDASAYRKSESVGFVVKDDFSSISVISPRNLTYSISEVPLVFSGNQPDFRVKYSVDYQENVTVAGNTALTGLDEGSHKLLVYAKDGTGNVGQVDVVFFNVDVQPTPTPSTSPEATSAPSRLPSPSLSPSPNPSTSVSASVSPTSTPTKEPTATPPPNLPKQQKDFWSTSVPVEYIFMVTAVFAAVIFIIIFLAIRNRKHKP